MLEVSGFVVRYGSVEAVRGVDLHVDAGEAVALLGANGAGKTSLLRAVSRLIPAEGQIRFDGADVSDTAPEDLARRGLVHVPEGRRVFATLTVNDNLLVGQTAKARRSALFTPDSVYDLFPALRPLRNRYGWGLSGGEQQMVAIGRALLASPRLLMLDEPSLGLAPIVVKAVYQALSEIKDQLSIIVVEQNAAVALQLCDRAYVLASGELVLQGTIDELSDRQVLMDSYLGHDPGTLDAADGSPPAPASPANPTGPAPQPIVTPNLNVPSSA